MFDRFSDGYCPQCLLDNEQRPMILNSSDFWECPVCRLQAHGRSKWMFALMRKRGGGRLKEEKATDSVVGHVLCRSQEDDWKAGEAFKTEAELRDFLKNEVISTTTGYS